MVDANWTPEMVDEAIQYYLPPAVLLAYAAWLAARDLTNQRIGEARILQEWVDYAEIIGAVGTAAELRARAEKLEAGA